MLSAATRARIVREFQSAARRLLLLDYDGTLISIKPTLEQGFDYRSLRWSEETASAESDAKEVDFAARQA